MAKKKNFKSALVMAIMSLVVCLSMFAGTTFAWFTDSVTSTGNVIKSGTLDAEMYWAVANEDPSATTAWKDASKIAIFDYDNWEPGYADAKHVKIENVGSLAFKYDVRIEAEGVVSKLAEVIDVYYADPATKISERSSFHLLKNVGTLKQLLEGEAVVGEGDLLAGKSDIVTIVLKMNENAGNAYQGLEIGSSFVVKLVATQMMSESDSFGPDYDEEASINDAIFEFGGNIIFEEDFNREVNIADGVDVNIDLNDNKITDTIVNNGNLNVSGGDVESDSYGLWNDNGNANVTDVEMNAGNPAEYSNVTINNAVTVYENVNIVSAGGGIGAAEGGKVIFKSGSVYIDSTATSGRYNFYTEGVGSEIIIEDGTFGFHPTKNQKRAYICAVAGSTVIVKGGTFGPASKKSGYEKGIKGDGTVIIYGGTFGFDPSEWVATGYSANDNGDGTWTVGVNKASIKDGIADAIASGETDVVVDAGGANIGNLEYGLNTSLVPAGSTVTIKNATTSGQSYGNAVAGTVVFENCVFNNENGAYSIHFDAGGGDVVFKNCTLAGWCSFGSAINSVKFEGCTIQHNGHYGQLRFYQPVDMKDTVIAPDVTVDASSNCELKLDNCTVEDGSYIAEVIYVDDCFTGITIDGVKVAHTKAALDSMAAANATVYLLKNDAGEVYDLSGNQYNGLKIIGLEDGIKLVNNTDYASSGKLGAIWKAIHLENVTVTNTVYTMADGGDATFKNVNFSAGVRRAYGKNVVFTDCTFGSNSEGYALHFESDSASAGGNIQLSGCKFMGGKVHLGSKRAYTFTGCDFVAGTDFQVWSSITLSGCTVDGTAVVAGNIATLFPNLNVANVTLA